MIGARHEQPGRLTVQFLRLQYWYDRLTEPHRLLVGFGTILFLGACLLYVLGFTSSILVSRMELGPGLEPAEVRPPAPVVVEAPAPSQRTPVPATPTATPAVDPGGSLIQPPDVPEVAIIPAPPRIYEPQPQPLKPRVVATPAATARAPAPTAAPAQPTRASVGGTGITPAPTPQRTVVPANGPAAGVTPTPVRPQQSGPPAQQAGPTATRAPANPPTAAPRATTPAPPQRGPQATPTGRPR